MTSIILFIVALGVIQFILNKTTLRERDSMSQTNGFEAYVWSIVIIAVVTFICVFLFKDYNSVLVVSLTVMFGVRAVFEWRYLRSAEDIWFHL